MDTEVSMDLYPSVRYLCAYFFPFSYASPVSIQNVFDSSSSMIAVGNFNTNSLSAAIFSLLSIEFLSLTLEFGATIASN